MFQRVLSQKIDRYLQDGFPTIIIIGQRRVGKTVELKRHLHGNALYFDLEDIDNRELFSTPSTAHLKTVLGNEPKTVLLDEIQYAENIGSVLKIIQDHLPHITVLASGSASFLMMQRIGDSALGRKVLFEMYPLTTGEIMGHIGDTYTIGGFRDVICKAPIEHMIPHLLVHGSLPKVYTREPEEYKRVMLEEYIRSVLFRDVFEIETIRNPAKVRKLAQLLALQVGNLVNTNEIAQMLELSRDTVVHYIDLLEKFHIIQTVGAYSLNPRKELNNPFKVYFTDLGIRNALVDDFRPINQREPKQLGGLFENLVFNTLQSNISYYSTGHKIHYWRDRNGYEVDFVLTNQLTGKLTPIEVKFRDTAPLTKSFSRQYQEKIDSFHCINAQNYWQYV